jgi:hypothetical protein
MSKVVTSQGLTEFVQSGKTEDMKPEIKPAEKVAPSPEEKAEVPVPPPIPSEDEGLEAEDFDLSEIVRKKIGKKHRQMKEAQETAAEDRRLAEQQYNRAILAEQRAAALEKELGETKKVQTTKEPELKKPDIKDFTDDKGQIRWTDYTEATSDFASKKAVQDYAARQAQEREAAERAEAARKFREKAEKIPDYQETISAATTWFPNAVLDYITESEDGPEISVYLAKNPETADRISKLPPIRAIAEIGKLAKTFNVPKVVIPEPKVERGGAPPPITPLSATGAGTVQTDPSKMSFRELREYERAQRKKR